MVDGLLFVPSKITFHVTMGHYFIHVEDKPRGRQSDFTSVSALAAFREACFWCQRPFIVCWPPRDKRSKASNGAGMENILHAVYIVLVLDFYCFL
jgi:hypothetical protein